MHCVSAELQLMILIVNEKYFHGKPFFGNQSCKVLSMTLTLKTQGPLRFLKLIWIPDNTHQESMESQILILIIDKNDFDGKPFFWKPKLQGIIDDPNFENTGTFPIFEIDLHS